MKIKAGQTAVVTGAGGGLGSALAVDLARRGCNLALVDISQEALDKTRAALPTQACNVSLHTVDVTDADAMRELADAVVAEHGGVNLLINNAGITLQKNFSTHTLEDWQRIVDINLWGVIHGCHMFDEALGQAAESGKGAHVVNLSSMSSFAGLPAQSSYCATKAAVEMLSQSLWAEWSQRGIGVTSIHPGAIRTDMILATLQDSDDIEAAKKNYDMAHKMGIDADKAAAKILRAVEKGKRRQIIGKESYIIHYLSRFAPPIASAAMKSIAKKQAAG